MPLDKKLTPKFPMVQQLLDGAPRLTQIAALPDPGAEQVLADDGTGEMVWIDPGGPTDADYLVKTANADLSAERVVTDTTDITWDWATAGQAKAVTKWTVVSDSSATVSPTASDSGKYYRLTHANPTFNLPTSDLVVGQTHFWVTFTGGSSPTGTVDSGLGNTVDCAQYDIPSASNPVGAAARSFSTIFTFQVYLIRYIAANTWASNLQSVI